jgi:5-methylcytosine-specific restriction enzyme subunit McrC
MSIEAQDTIKEEYNNEKHIPIKNIYYMLSYVFKNLKIKDKIERECEDFNNVHDLFSRLLIDGVNTLIRNGFYKQYVFKKENTSRIHGKINLTSSIKNKSFIYRQLNCEFDEFSENILFNQIVKTTINKLIRYRDLNRNLKKKLNKLTPFFDNVNEIELNSGLFNSLNWNKNNLYYRLIINICRMVFETTFLDDSTIGTVSIRGIEYEKAMHYLYELFIFNYYKKEFNEFKVHRSPIYWNIDNSFHNIGENHLPRMNPDIILEHNSKQLIIDTKYYKKTLSTFHDKEMIHSENLYQLYSYMSQSDFHGEINGMLLYPTVDREVDFQYKIDNFLVFIKTINLNQDWSFIEDKLGEIAEIVKTCMV